jgi:CDP-diacylglycerol--glycerol-3-phosphate 3-phosphatidyltransferase
VATEDPPPTTDATPATAPARENRLTVPNVLCAIRLVGSPFLLLLAWAELAAWCLALFVVLLLTDWLDGKLARLLRQQTAFGTRLDSFADATFYGCTLIATGLLRWDILVAEWLWIGAAVASYLVTLTAGLLKFGRVPSYHTRLAKTSWLLVGIGFVAILADYWPAWPLRVAAAGVLLTNLEATAITVVLSRPRLNVLSLYHAIRAERQEG